MPPTLESNNETKFEACGRNRITSGTSGWPLGPAVIPQWPSGPVPCALRKSLGVDSDLVKRMFQEQLVNHHQLFHLNDSRTNFNNVKAVKPLPIVLAHLHAHRFGPPHPRTWHPRSKRVPKTPLCHSLRPRRLAWPGSLEAKQRTSMKDVDKCWQCSPGW